MLSYNVIKTLVLLSVLHVSGHLERDFLKFWVKAFHMLHFDRELDVPNCVCTIIPYSAVIITVRIHAVYKNTLNWGSFRSAVRISFYSFSVWIDTRRSTEICAGWYTRDVQIGMHIIFYCDWIIEWSDMLYFTWDLGRFFDACVSS